MGPPDKELIGLGESGSLLDPTVKAKQINRMMSDEKFDLLRTMRERTRNTSRDSGFTIRST